MLTMGTASGAIGVTDVESRRAIVCISTSTPVEGRGGSHAEWLDMEGADLSTLNSGRAPLLLDHTHAYDHLVGVVERAWVDDDSAFASVRFAPTQRATEAWVLVRGGFLSNVSIGYMHSLPDDPVNGSTRIARWIPYEVSLVTVPRCWEARTMLHGLPRPVADRLAERAAAGAATRADTWRAWSEGAAERLARQFQIDAGLFRAGLLSEVEAEISRLGMHARDQVLRTIAGAIANPMDQAAAANGEDIT